MADDDDLDIPEVGEAWFACAELRHGDKVIRPALKPIEAYEAGKASAFKPRRIAEADKSKPILGWVPGELAEGWWVWLQWTQYRRPDSEGRMGGWYDLNDEYKYTPEWFIDVPPHPDRGADE